MYGCRTLRTFATSYPGHFVPSGHFVPYPNWSLRTVGGVRSDYQISHFVPSAESLRTFSKIIKVHNSIHHELLLMSKMWKSLSRWSLKYHNLIMKHSCGSAIHAPISWRCLWIIARDGIRWNTYFLLCCIPNIVGYIWLYC